MRKFPVRSVNFLRGVLDERWIDGSDSVDLHDGSHTSCMLVSQIWSIHPSSNDHVLPPVDSRMATKNKSTKSKTGLNRRWSNFLNPRSSEISRSQWRLVHYQQAFKHSIAIRVQKSGEKLVDCHNKKREQTELNQFFKRADTRSKWRPLIPIFANCFGGVSIFMPKNRAVRNYPETGRAIFPNFAKGTCKEDVKGAILAKKKTINLLLRLST